MTSAENERLHDAHERLRALVDASEVGNAEPGAVPEPASLPELAGAFGPYELERSLGHGGQGVVYLATDTRLGRKVALKLLTARASAGTTARARFEREAAAASRLRHANICTVYEAGELDGQRFLAMEYVAGEALTDWIARTVGSVASTGAGSGSGGSKAGARRERVEEALRLVEQIARAVHAAHESGVVHRDLKPQNIMLRSDGSPVVLDFGLARDDSDDDAALTLQGDVLGTPAYMPPERVRGAGGGAADPREDVYGLGAILYECLTGERPFRGHTREQLYQRILTAQVEDPRGFDTAIPREARFVVETALEKSPDRRYASARELADELQRLRRRESIRARPVPAWLRLQRWVQRHPAAAIPTIAAFLLLTTGVVTSLLLLREVEAESQLADVRALLSESALQSTQDPQVALQLALDASRQLPSHAPEELRVEMRSQLVEALASVRLLRHMEHQDDRMVGVGFSGDGQRVATVVRGARTPPLRLWPVDGGAPTDSAAIVPEPEWPKQNGQLTGCAFDDAGTRVLVTPIYGVPRVLSLEDASQMHVLMPRDKPRNGKPARIHFWHDGVRDVPGRLACFVPGSSELALVGAQDGARLWRLWPGEVAGEEVWHDRRAEWGDGVCQIAVSADGALCATGDHDGEVRLLRVDPFAVVGCSTEQELHGPAVHALAFDPRRPLLLSASWEKPPSIWSTAVTPDGKLQRVGTLPVHGITAGWLEFAPPVAGRPDVLAVLDTDRGVQLYRSVTGPEHFQHYATVRGSNAEVVTMAFSPDGSKFVTGTKGGDVRVYDLEGRLKDVMRGSPSTVLGSCWSPDGRSLVTSEIAGSARLWRATDPRLRVHKLPRALFRMVCAGGRLVVSMRDGGVAFMDLEDESFLIRRAPNRRVGVSLAIRADGQRLAVADVRQRIDFWDLSGSVPRLESESAERWPAMHNDALAFAEDGSLIVSAGNALHAVRPDGVREQLMKYEGNASMVATGRGIAVANRKQAAWSCEPLQPDGEQVLWPADLDEDPIQTTVSADGRWLALLATPREDLVPIRVVDAVERRLLFAIEERGARGVALNADGSRMATTTAYGAVRLWDLSTGAPRLLLELSGHDGIAHDVLFHPDGRQLITCGSDGTIRFWPIVIDDLERLAKERVVGDGSEAVRERPRVRIGR